jgi:hypothetical protein
MILNALYQLRQFNPFAYVQILAGNDEEFAERKKSRRTFCY